MLSVLYALESFFHQGETDSAYNSFGFIWESGYRFFYGLRYLDFLSVQDTMMFETYVLIVLQAVDWLVFQEPQWLGEIH